MSMQSAGGVMKQSHKISAKSQSHATNHQRDLQILGRNSQPTYVKRPGILSNSICKFAFGPAEPAVPHKSARKPSVSRYLLSPCLEKVMPRNSNKVHVAAASASRKETKG